MPGNETRSSQFGLVGGIRQSVSDRITCVEPNRSSVPETRKGRLYIVTEAEHELAQSHDACQLVANTLHKAFYHDTSPSITASLRAAIHAANKTLYQHNFNKPDQQRAYVGLTCAVVKKQDLFIAQVAPAQAYTLTDNKLRAMPTHPSWNPAHTSAMPFLRQQALGTSLFVEPEFYRSLLRPGDALAICTSNIAPLLSREDIERILRYQDPVAATETLHNVCRQAGLVAAHGLVIELVPALSTEARTTPLSAPGLRERGGLVFQSIGHRMAGVLQETTRLFRGSRRSRSVAADNQPTTTNGTKKAHKAAPSMVEPPEHPVEVAPHPQPIELGASLSQRYEQEPFLQHNTLKQPPSTFLGESLQHDRDYLSQQQIDKHDAPTSVIRARPYRMRHELRPLVDMTWSERLLLPFEQVSHAVVDWISYQRRRRKYPPVTSVVRNQGLSYRHQRPAFPWIPLFMLLLLVTALILYGTNLSRRSAQEQVQQDLERADQYMAAVYEAPNNTSALDQLEKARQQIEYVQSSSLVTETNAPFWLHYQELRRDYERAQAELQRLSFLENPTLLAEHPQLLPDELAESSGVGGRFSSIIVPPSTAATTDPLALEALGYIYALDSNDVNSRLYRIPRDGGIPEPYLSRDEPVQRSIVGPIQSQSWRIDSIVAIDQGPNGFGYYFRSGGEWNYTRLGGSEVWSLRDRLDLETYEGSLYVWGAQPGEILKYNSGAYGDSPTLWLDPGGLEGYTLNSAIDMAIDGRIYLLQPDGRVVVLSAGRFEREIIPEELTPPLTLVTRFFVTGPPDFGSIYLLDALYERVIQIEKSSGNVIQQMRVRPDSPLQLDYLTDLFVDESGPRTLIYLANGGQIIRADIAPPPRPFRRLVDPVDTSPDTPEGVTPAEQ